MKRVISHVCLIALTYMLLMGSLAAQQTVDELSREELVSYACNAHAAAEERKKAIELLAKKDDWQSLGALAQYWWTPAED